MAQPGSDIETSAPPEPSTRAVAAFYIATAAVLYVIVAAANIFLPHSKDSDNAARIPGQSVLGGWLEFDSTWYTSIAAHGYYYIKGQQSPVAFFPAYPLVVRVLTVVFRNEALAAVVLTVVCGLVVALLYWRWLGDRLHGRQREVAFALLLLYPYAWFLYGTAYADAFFLALVLGAFLAADRRNWLLAGVLGGIASAARPVAPAVIIGLVCVALDRQGVLRVERRRGNGTRRVGVHVDTSKLQASILWLALSVTGLAAWCAYLWHRFGDPIAFMTVQAAPGWSQPAGPHTWFKIGFFDLVFGGHLFVLRLFPQAFVTVLFLCLAPAVARRFGWGYGAYVLVVIGIPALGTGDFQGMGRYALAAFPVFALVGAWIVERGRAWTNALVVTSAACLAIGALLFGTGAYLT